MKSIISVLLALALFAGITTVGTKGAAEKAAQAETSATTAAAHETTDGILPVAAPAETAPASAVQEAAPTASGTQTETSVSFTTAHGENLPITDADMSVLWKMAYFLDYTTDYDCERDDGERFICYGCFGGAIFELCDCYGVPTGDDCHAENESDPLGLMPYAEGTEGARYWFWSRINADAVDYIVRNVFNTTLPTPGDPEDTIAQGYYYLDGFYYINTGMGGSEYHPQITACTLGENGRYILQFDWVFDPCCTGGEIESSARIEASLHMVDGRRMWTIYRIETLTDDPCQPMG